MDVINRVERGASILVVDDNELNRDALSCLLRLHQYEVEGAGDGQAALSLLNTRRFDLVVLDIEMPGLSGIEVLTPPDQAGEHPGDEGAQGALV